MEQGKGQQQSKQQQQATKQPHSGRSAGQDDAVGKDTDNDGRVVKPGHKPGEVDGPKSR